MKLLVYTAIPLTPGRFSLLALGVNSSTDLHYARCWFGWHTD